MSSPTPIITPPPKKQNRVSVLPQGIEPVKVMAKKYTTYVWAFVAALPELYAGLLALGPVPDQLRHTLWGVAAFGLACSWVKQRIDHA